MTYIHTDGLGNPVARTNEKGELISRTRYEPYGATAGGATPGNTGKSFNRYVYGDNNPYKYIDPDGREQLDAYCLAGGGCNKYAGSSGSAGRSESVAKGAAIGTAVGVAASLACGAGTLGVCAIGNAATARESAGASGCAAHALSRKVSAQEESRITTDASCDQ